VLEAKNNRVEEVDTNLCQKHRLNVRANGSERPSKNHHEPRWLDTKTLERQQQHKVVRAAAENTGPTTEATATVNNPKPKQGNTAPQPSKASKPSWVQVKGARKIWGTMKSATTAVVANALKTLTKMPPNSLTIKRKYKIANNNPKQVTRWWFVVRGEECLLEQLQASWQSVSIQTSWKLEPVLKHQMRDNLNVIPSSAELLPAESDGEAAVFSDSEVTAVNNGAIMTTSNGDPTAVSDDEATANLSRNVTRSFLDMNNRSPLVRDKRMLSTLYPSPLPSQYLL